MIFQKRVDRAFDYLKKKSGKDAPRELPEEYDPKNDIEEPPMTDMMEKGDFAAMVISALLVLVPICIVVLLVMVVLPALFMG